MSVITEKQQVSQADIIDSIIDEYQHNTYEIIRALFLCHHFGDVNSTEEGIAYVGGDANVVLSCSLDSTEIPTGSTHNLSGGWSVFSWINYVPESGDDPVLYVCTASSLTDATWIAVGSGVSSSSNVTEEDQTVDSLVAEYELVYFDPSEDKWMQARADNEKLSTAMLGVFLGNGIVLREGVVTSSGLTANKLLYLSPSTSGGITDVLPGESYNIREIGFSLTSSQYFFSPDTYTTKMSLNTSTSKLELTLGDRTISVPVTNNFSETPTLATEQFVLDSIGTSDSSKNIVLTGDFDSEKDYINTDSRMDLAKYNGQNYSYIGENLNTRLAPGETTKGLIAFDGNTGLNIINYFDQDSPYSQGVVMDDAMHSVADGTVKLFLHDDKYVLYLAGKTVYSVDLDELLGGEIEKINALPVNVSGTVLYAAATKLDSKIFAFVETDEGVRGFQVFDIADDGSLSYEGNLRSLSGRPYGVDVTDAYVYVAEGDRIEIFENDGAGYAKTGEYSGTNLVDIVAAEPNNALYAVNVGNLYTINIYDPSSPSLESTNAVPQSAYIIKYSNSHILVADGEKILIYDASTPLSPSYLTQIQMLEDVSDFIIDDDYLYIGTKKTVSVFDISTWSSPSAVSGSEISVGSDLQKLVYDENFLKEWLAYDGGFNEIEDAAVPSLDMSLLDEKSAQDDTDYVMIQQEDGTRMKMKVDRMSNKIIHDRTCTEATGTGVVLQSDGSWVAWDRSDTSLAYGIVGIHLGDGEILLWGTNTTTGITQDGVYYMGEAGALTTIPPVAESGSVLRVLAFGISATESWFCPSNDSLYLASAS